MTLTVVIPHYFAARLPNLPLLIAALQAGTLPPTEILIWNNDQPFAAPILGATVVQSPRNVGCRGRLIAGLLAQTDEVVFHDNDLCVRATTLEDLLKWRPLYPTAILSADGRRGPLGTDYRGWDKVRSSSVTVPTPVTMSLGRLEAVPTAVLPSLLAHLPLGSASLVMDDLWFSAAAHREGHPILVVPSAGLLKLPNGGVGLSRSPAYYAERTRVATEVLPGA